ncbi:zinc ribbon domain-containing protein [Kitasatospora sp. NPDC101155]|uniref:zinc ribbon domain-containing protein n=1 Tax=Kitasatospora sp. NPDC101155 TaxID=3364097 RepID=UPI0037FB23D3
MTLQETGTGTGHARWTFRLRVSATTEAQLMSEWGKCRWIWNEAVAKSRAVHQRNKATGEKNTCGPARLDKMLTEARTRNAWLRDGSSVPQQQIIRDFGKSREVRLIHPAHTTMDCAHCGARAKHALPLGMRTYTCTACGVSSPRDKNSARVMLVRAGLNPADVEGVRHGCA